VLPVADRTCHEPVREGTAGLFSAGELGMIGNRFYPGGGNVRSIVFEKVQPITP
jgi:hypothetical protein